MQRLAFFFKGRKTDDITVCLCGRVPLFKLSNQLTDFYETCYVQYVIGAYPNAVHFMLSFLTAADAQSCELGGFELERYALEITKEYLHFGTVKICIDSSRPSPRINSVQLQPCF